MIIEPLICLLERMSSIDENKEVVKPLKRSLHSLMESTNETRKEELNGVLAGVLKNLYTEYRAQIVEKDFSFMQDNLFIFENTDISHMYLLVLDQNDGSIRSKVSNMMLELFFHVATDADKEIIKTKHMPKKEPKEKKPKAAAPQSASGNGGPS